MGLVDLITDLNNRRKVRSQARECRKSGATNGMIDHSLSIVCEIARQVGDEDASPQYVKTAAASRLESRLPGLDPATILLLVQLIVLIYQALKAVGFLDQQGLASVSPETINEHFGGL